MFLPVECRISSMDNQEVVLSLQQSHTLNSFKNFSNQTRDFRFMQCNISSFNVTISNPFTESVKMEKLLCEWMNWDETWISTIISKASTLNIDEIQLKRYQCNDKLKIYLLVFSAFWICWWYFLWNHSKFLHSIESNTINYYYSSCVIFLDVRIWNKIKTS